MTPTDLKKLTGIPQSQIWTAINNPKKGSLPRHRVKQVADALNLPVEALTPGAGELTIQVRVLGKIRAGRDGLAHAEQKELLHVQTDLLPRGDLFALDVEGDSMIGAHIDPDDIVVFRRTESPRVGDVVAVTIGHETTLKRFALSEGRHVFRSETTGNPPDIEVAPGETWIHGVGVLLIRRNLSRPRR